MSAVARTDRPGIALLAVMLLTMVVGAIAAGAALIGANSFLINQYDQRSSLLETVADAGLELARARLNANPGLYVDTMVNTLELNASVVDATGRSIRGVTRSVYAIPVGGGAGEYGNFASLVAIASDADGARVIRRVDLLQESFAIFGYFTHYESTDIAFGNRDELYGRVHSNSNIKVRSTGATFHGPVTTAGVFEGASYATFLDDTTSQVTQILMPTSTQLARLRTRASPAGLALAPAASQFMRIEFVSRDVDNDGVEEGFIRVYDSTRRWWVEGKMRSDTTYATVQDQMGDARNCGHFEDDGTFNVAALDTRSGHGKSYVLTSATRQCFLGGDPVLSGGVFQPTDSRGAWRTWGGSTPSYVADEPDGGYLFPIDREINPAFRGVIHVAGSVVVSGTVRGRVTLAASGDIRIGDDLVYNTDPGSATCEDVLGLFAGGRVVVLDNTVNAPRQPPSSTNWYDYDDTEDEYIHGSILALNTFEVETAWAGATAVSTCGTDAYGNPQWWGRGCLHVAGGLTQNSRGTVAYGNGTGYIKRYTHDTCAYTAPPPYFPSTGHFTSHRYYEVDPTGFTIQAYFNALN